MPGSGAARTTGSTEHLPRSWCCPASVPAVLRAAVTAGWTCHGRQCWEPLCAVSTAARGSTAGRTRLHITSSSPCPGISPPAGARLWGTLGRDEPWAHSTPAGASAGAAVCCHGHTGDFCPTLALGNTACSRVMALRLLTPAEARMRTPGAGEGDLAPAPGEEERGGSPGTAAPTRGRGQCWGPETSDPGTIICPRRAGSEAATGTRAGVLIPSRASGANPCSGGGRERAPSPPGPAPLWAPDLPPPQGFCHPVRHPAPAATTRARERAPHLGSLRPITHGSAARCSLHGDTHGHLQRDPGAPRHSHGPAHAPGGWHSPPQPGPASAALCPAQHRWLRRQRWGLHALQTQGLAPSALVQRFPRLAWL